MIALTLTVTVGLATNTYAGNIVSDPGVETATFRTISTPPDIPESIEDKDLMKRFHFALLFSTTVASMNAGTILDDFNRANASTLGSNWTQQVGTDQILSDRATAIDDQSIATFNGLSSNSTFASAFVNGSSPQYIALVFDYVDPFNSIFIKVQANNGISFDHYAFYYGNNGYGSDGTFQPLGSTFTSALIWATVSGTNATLNIDPSFTGVAQQTYTFSYTQNPGGTGTGLGFFGGATADNFGTGVPSSITPEPGTFALLGSALVGVTLLSKRLRR